MLCRWIPHAFFFLAGSCFPGETLDAAENPRPNIILLMADDLGWGDVGFNGHPYVVTPHLDRLADDGVRLERFYAQAPSCSPTRASAMTGRNGYRFGVIRANNGRLEPEELNLAEVLRAAGYRTGHFGKWHLGTLTRDRRDAKRGGTPKGEGAYAPPWEHGFDVCFSTESKVPTWNPTERPDNNVMTWWAPREVQAGGEGWVDYGTYYWTGPNSWATENLSGDDSRIIMDRALPFMEDAVATGRPFFAVIWFHAPHTPVVAGPEFTRFYAGRRGFERHYFGSITAMDAQVGRLRAALEGMGQARNTLVFFTSDNGPEDSEQGGGVPPPGTAGPFRGAKRFLYEGGIRVPGIAWWPDGLDGGRGSRLPMTTSDYLPSVLGLLGEAAPAPAAPLDGIDSLALLRAGIEVRGAPIPFEFVGQVAWIDDRYKLYSDDDGASFRLFDLLRDPGETRDLSARLPVLTRDMAVDLQAWRSRVREDWPPLRLR